MYFTPYEIDEIGGLHMNLAFARIPVTKNDSDPFLTPFWEKNGPVTFFGC